jgi:diaminopimelate decarboxylase
VSAAATPAVLRAAAALGDGDGPALIFDLGVVRARMVRGREAAKAAGVELLYAVKSFPLPVAIELAVAQLDGLDVAGPEEQAAALAAAPTNVTITWPGDVDVVMLAALAARHHVTAVCETTGQLAAAARVANVGLAVRLASDDDSRFGVAPGDLRAMIAAAAAETETDESALRDRVRALHVHGGPLATSTATIAARARFACEAAAAAGIALDQLDLGGSLHGFALSHATSGQALLADAFAAARAAVPAHVRLLFEPGRLWTEGAGFACGRILAARDIATSAAHVGGELATHVSRAERAVRVVELSRLCHLRWSTPRLVAPPPRAGEPRVAVMLLGATCCEDDLIGDALVPPEFLAQLEPGARALFAGVSGYAAGWNRAFAGVPAARVIIVG